jgi:3-hydroxybutyryl-CoA dehydrogenase
MQTQTVELETRISNKDIQKIAVLGQGVMGVDIAITFALAGYKVTAVDIYG